MKERASEILEKHFEDGKYEVDYVEPYGDLTLIIKGQINVTHALSEDFQGTPIWEKDDWDFLGKIFIQDEDGDEIKTLKVTTINGRDAVITA